MDLQQKRSALFSSRAYIGPDPEYVEFDTDEGIVIIEVRAPKFHHMVKGFSDPNKPTEAIGRVPLEELILDCCYDPDSGQPFFTKAHLETLENSSGHDQGVVQQIRKAIVTMRKKTTKPTNEELVGNSSGQEGGSYGRSQRPADSG